MNMNAVGIDVSKRKSTVAILRPGGEIVKKPFDVPHLSSDFRSLTRLIQDLDGETRIVMGMHRFTTMSQLPADCRRQVSSSVL